LYAFAFLIVKGGFVGLSTSYWLLPSQMKILTTIMEAKTRERPQQVVMSIKEILLILADNSASCWQS